MGCTDNDLCPLAALAAYTTITGSDNGPFLMLENRTPLAREQFVKMTKEKPAAAGIDSSCYSGHRFRIGAASVCGVEDSHTDVGALEECSISPVCVSSERKNWQA